MTQILRQSLNDVSQLIANRKLSPVELVEESLKQIENVNKHLCAYIDIFAEESLEIAKKIENDIRSGYNIGPLQGIPITLKDNINMKGFKTTAGSKILADWLPTEDAIIVARLKAAGAIILGKTNLHEFAWGATSENPFYGTVKNPWDHSRIAAGSSGGSAAAVAAHTCFGSIGTDTGGSIRLPASVCGLVGMRPTYGRVSDIGVIPLAASMDTVGPITRTVQDNELLFRAIAGNDSKEIACLKSSVQDNDKNLKDIRIGIIENYFDNAQNCVNHSIEEALDTFKMLGAKTVKIPIENIVHLQLVKERIQFIEASNFHQEWMETRIDDYGLDVRQRLLRGREFSISDYLEAKQYRKMIKQEVLDAFNNVDVIICPTLPFTAPKVGHKQIVIKNSSKVEIADYISYYTSLASIAGLPALSVPCGYDKNDLPIGFQLIGRPYDEAMLYHIGEVFQETTNFHLQYSNK